METDTGTRRSSRRSLFFLFLFLICLLCLEGAIRESETICYLPPMLASDGAREIKLANGMGMGTGSIRLDWIGLMG